MSWGLLRGVVLIGMLGAILIVFFEAGDLTWQVRDYVQDHLTEMESAFHMK